MRRPNDAVQARHSEIIRLLSSRGFLTVRDLSELLKISEVTVRRDLEVLDASGRINRRHGGAFRSIPAGQEMDEAIAVRPEITLKDPIHLIAARSLALVEPGNVILLSVGPISSEIAQGLLARRDITVITNSPAIFNTLRENEHLHLITTGGELLRAQNTLIGPLAEASVREIRVDKLFLEPSGISRRLQLFHSSIADVSMQQAMIQASREVIVVADSSVFGREGIMQIASIRIANKVILDDGISGEVEADIRSEGVEIVIANR